MGSDVISFFQDEGYWDVIHRAAGVLAGGGLVIFPTETVYGVGARADNSAAVDRLRRVKQRHRDKPFTVHLGRRDEVDRYVPQVSGLGRRLLRRGWPGPLTVLFPVSDFSAAPIVREIDRSAAAALYHDGVIGLRCPDHAQTRDLLNEAGGPVVAASANVAGRPPPRDVAESLRDLNDCVDLVLDGGPTRLSVPSTVVRLDGLGFEILRAGAYDEAALRRMAAMNLLFVCTGNTCRSPMAAATCERMLLERLGGDASALTAGEVSVRSCGVFASRNSGASPEAMEVMSRRGADLSRHRTQPLTAELIRQADHIYVMTRKHLERVVEMVPSAKDRCRLLSDGDIHDPIGGSTEVYAECADRIEESLRARLKEVEI